MLLEFLISSSLLALFILFVYSLLSGTSQPRRHLPPSPQPRLPIIGHLHLVDPLIHQSLHRLSLRHGPLFSLYFGSVPWIVACNPHFAKQILQTNELSFITRSQTSAFRRLTYNSSLAMAPYGPYWRLIKKLSMNELFGAGAINNFKSLRSQEYNRILRLLAQKAEAYEAVNVTEELLKWTNNVISRMMLGEAEEARTVVREAVKIFGEYNVSDYIWPFNKFDFRGYKKRTEHIFQRFDALIEKIIREREEIRVKRREKNGESHKGEGETRAFIDILLDYSKDESSEIKIQRDQIKGLIVDFFSAGTDSTAIATEWALAELINHPKVLKKARDEINLVIGKDRLVEESDVPNLPYIQAIVKETFRLHPSLPLVKRKCVEECTIENYVIPKNALMLINVWASGRDPKYWESPLEFKPDRFLKPSENGPGGLIDVKGQHFQLLPFGSGRRMCLGVNLAPRGIATVVASLIQSFDFHVVSPQGQILKGDDAVVNMDERPGLAVPRAHNLVCVPVARSTSGPLKILAS